jgi:hydroxypyruvate reductase
MLLADREGLYLLACGSDGNDGPGPWSGALVDGGTLARGRAQGLNPGHCLQHADSGTFLLASGDLVQTGPTGTNVADLALALVTTRDGDLR